MPKVLDCNRPPPQVRMTIASRLHDSADTEPRVFEGVDHGGQDGGIPGERPLPRQVEQVREVDAVHVVESSSHPLRQDALGDVVSVRTAEGYEPVVWPDLWDSLVRVEVAADRYHRDGVEYPCLAFVPAGRPSQVRRSHLFPGPLR